MTDLLASETDLGAVTLDVGDLDAVTLYYTEGIGLEVLAASGSSVRLGRAGRASVVLRHAPQLRHASDSAAGLFHTAVLFESNLITEPVQRIGRSPSPPASHSLSARAASSWLSNAVAVAKPTTRPRARPPGSGWSACRRLTR